MLMDDQKSYENKYPNRETVNNGEELVEELKSSPIQNQINDLKDKAAKNTQSLADQIESTPDILDETISELDEYVIDFYNKKNTELYETYKIQQNKFIQNLETEIKNHYERRLKLKSVYDKNQKMLFVLFIAILLSIFLPNLYLPLNRTIYSIQISQLIPCIIALAGILIISEKYNGAYHKSKFDEPQLLENKDILIQAKPSSTELNKLTEKTQQLSTHFKSIVGLIDTCYMLADEFVPVINKTYSAINTVVNRRQRVNAFMAAMEYYNLSPDYGKGVYSITKLTKHLSSLTNESDWDSTISNEISTSLKKGGMGTSSEIILMLYREHSGTDTRSLYRSIKESDNELCELSNVLIYSRRLVDMPNSDLHNPEDIIPILKLIDYFSISEINKILSKVIRLLGYLTSYVEFLVKNGIDVDFNPNIEFIVAEISDIDDKFEKQIIELSCKIGYKALSKQYIQGELLDGFVNGSISIKFHDEVSLRELACKCSGNDNSTAVIKAYYDKNKEVNRQNIVYLSELINDIGLIQQNLSNSKDKDFQFLKTQLKEGKWYDNSASFMIDFIETKTCELKNQLSKLENYKIINEVIRDIFRKVKIGTIDKAIDSQAFGAYLIMSKKGQGSLLTLVDKLSIRNSGHPDLDKRWEMKRSKDINVIRRDCKVESSYDFINFSDSTRIGILHKGESFIEFQNNFLGDMRTMLSNSNQTFESGLIIQRISPSKYSFGILEDEDLPINVNMKNLDIAEYLTRLASRYVTTEEQMIIGGLEKDIDLFEIIKTKTISEFIRQKNDDLKKIEIDTLDSPAFERDLMNHLENMGVNSLYSLAVDMHNKIVSKEDVVHLFEYVIEKHYKKTPGLQRVAKQRSEILSERFCLVLDGIGLIYEWYFN
jgi:hypothetical protein